MHGVKKSDITPERLEKVKANVEKYNRLNQFVLKAKRKHEISEEMLSKCSEILSINPEHYTVWNYRREMVSHWLGLRDPSQPTKKSSSLSSSSETTDTSATTKLTNDDKLKILEGELLQSMAALKMNPKSYCAFFHRRWVIEADLRDANESSLSGRIAVLDLSKELALCTKFLSMDSRNFHCWDHRRFVVKCMSVSKESESKLDEMELQYSTKLIEENFSNYSAWHSRALLLTKNGLTEDIVRKELEFATNAMFTEPNDQSAWLYQRWLLHAADERGVLEDSVLSEQFENCVELLSEESGAKWALIAQIMLASLMNQRGMTELVSSFDLSRNIDELITIDPKRKGYYLYLQSEMEKA